MLGMAMQTEEIEAIMQGDDYFVCERMHCRMTKAACVARQTRAAIIPLECKHCAQGNDIRASLADKNTREDIVMSKSGTCTNCGRENITLPAHNLCWVCYDAARNKTGGDREIALADVKERVKSGGIRKAGNGGPKKTEATKTVPGIGADFCDGREAKKDPGRFEKLGREVGALVDQKQAAYGDAFGKAGEIFRILYPDGIRPEQYEDVLTMVRIIDKQFRIATDKHALGESPYRDIAGYGLLGLHGGLIGINQD
jgi:hypothetical protein